MLALPPLDLRLLGPPTVVVAGRSPPPDVLWSKHLALLAYLALSPHHGRARAHLQALLWPEKDAEHARHSLNEAARRLRAGLGHARVVSRHDTLVLERRQLTVDVLAPDATTDARELMEGFSLPDAPAFEDWLAAERARLRATRLAAAVARAERQLAANEPAAARGAAAEALRLDPLHEPAVRAAMRAAALDGDTSGALAVYAAFADRCGEELGTAPSRPLAALAQTIRTGAWRRPRAPARARPPLVGRAAAHARVFGLARDALRGRPTVIKIAGPAGSGRSRLLDEIAERWILEGGRTVVARPIELDRGREWSTVRLLFRHGLATAGGLPAAPPRALGVLAGIVPELAERAAPQEHGGIAEVADALAAVLTAVTDDAPLLVAIDDAEHADARSLAAFQTALGQLGDVPLGIVLTGAAAPNGSAALSGMTGPAGARVAAAVVHLEPLTAEDGRVLADALAPWCTDDAQRARLARRLFAETEGNPLLMTTLLQGLQDVASLRQDAAVWPPPQQTLNAPVPAEVSQLAQAVTQARLQQLDAGTREFFVAATLCGRVVVPDLVARIVAIDARAAEWALTELEGRGLLTFDGDRYVLPAPLLAAAAASAVLTRGQLKRLRDRRDALLSGSPRMPEAAQAGADPAPLPPDHPTLP